MKKIFAILAAAMLLGAPAANAQALLNKLKEKAGEAVGNAINSKLSEKVQNAASKVGEKIGDKVGEITGVDVNSAAKTAKDGITVVSGDEMIQPRHASSFCWTEAVTPSTAKFPAPLLKELPAVPSASELANPTEAAQAAYYRAIKAVTLRAEELNSSTTCEDDMTELWRADYENALTKSFGLTKAELEALESGKLTPEEEEALRARIAKNLLGGASVADLEAEAKRVEAMGEDGLMEVTYKATSAVYDKHNAEIKKYMGVTADELKAQMRLNMQDTKNTGKSEKEFEAKVKAYQKQQAAADKNFQKEADAFGNSLQKEVLAAVRAATPGVGTALDMMGNIGKVTEALSPLMERQKKLEKYAKDVMAAWPETVGNVREIGLVDRKKLEDIKAKILASNDPAVYNPLYVQAGEIIKNHRMKTAQAWAADVQKRFNKIQEAMPNLVQIQRQAVEDKLIPECALWRTPLNLVIEAGDILQDAYADFPISYPKMYGEEVVRKVKLSAGEEPWWPEFYIASETLNEILAGKNIFKADGKGNYYQFNAGKWIPVSKDFGLTKKAGKADVKSQGWTSSDGKRTVKLDAEYGQQIFLPEGDIITDFAAVEKQGNDIVWARISTEEDADGSIYYVITKCTYKL